MLQPQSTALFILLMAVFCGLLVWLALTRQPVLRVLAACLAFIPAMLFGVAAVNKYYDYYQTWGSVLADLGSQGVSQGTAVPGTASSQNVAAILGHVTIARSAATQGETIRLKLSGSHLSRDTYVYLPPEYFRRNYARYHFPAIELLPGFPGQPQDWINVVGIIQAYSTLLAEGSVKPVVLVMPDANGGRRDSLQCLNVVHGPQDATYLARDVPAELSRVLRLAPPGRGWGIAGYSEGGYCAANLALRYPLRYGASGVLSGYFVPSWDQIGSPPRPVPPFGHGTSARTLRRENSPLVVLRKLPVNAVLPRFWLGAGSLDAPDVRAARRLQNLLLLRQPAVQLHLEPGGGHTMATWRALVPPMLEWMTPLLAEPPGSRVVQRAEARKAHVRSATSHDKALIPPPA